MRKLSRNTSPSERKPVTGMRTNTYREPTIIMLSRGVRIRSSTSGMTLRSPFSTLESSQTPIITPMMPPLPVVRMELRGTSAL